MKLMKLSAAFAAAALLLASCSTPTNSTVSSTDLSGKGTVASAYANNTSTFLTVGSPTSGVIPATTLGNAINQVLTYAVNAPLTLSGTTVPGLTIYTLSSAASGTASFVRSATGITYSAVQRADNTLVLTLDLSATSYANSELEVVFNAAALTSTSGLKLDGNVNKTSGEATDDVVQYVTIGTPALTGTTESPSATITFPTLSTAAYQTAAGTTITYTGLADTAGTTVPNLAVATVFSPTNTKLQKYDYAARAWVDQTYTAAATSATAGTLTTAASVAGAAYRFYLVDATAITESAKTNGYTHSLSYATKAFANTSFAVGTRAYTDGTNTYSLITPTVTAVAATGGQPAYVKLNFTGLLLGTAGLDASSITASTVQLFKSTTGAAGTAVAVEWASVAVTSSSPTSVNDTVWLYLPSNYTKGATAAVVKIFGVTGTGTGTTGKIKIADLSNTDSSTTVTGDLSTSITIPGGL